MASPSVSFVSCNSKPGVNRFRLSAMPCFVCGTRWASRWTDGTRFPAEELMACFGVTGTGVLCQGCRAAVYHRRRTGGRKTFFHFRNARRDKTGPDGTCITSPVRRPTQPRSKLAKKRRGADFSLHGLGKSPLHVPLRRHGHSRQRALVGPGQARCEFCQHIGRATEFMPSMRFCSLRCSRAYSTQFRSVNRAKAIRDFGRPAPSAGQPVDTSRPTVHTSTMAKVLSPRSSWPGGAAASSSNTSPSSAPLFYDPQTREYYLDSSMRAPLVLAGFGLMPRSRDENGRLIFRRLPIVDIPMELRRTPPNSWTVEDCKAFLAHNHHGKEADILSEHDIDGAAFLLIQLEHLVRILGLKVGPALKLAAIAQKLRLLCAD